MTMAHVQLRNLFIEFWKKRDHKEVPPISLVPQNDPTTLFTGSGMQPLVPYLLGESHPQGTRLYNIQPCFRTQDIEEVGDNRHTTFFEMMGNWSLGDYFKKEQLAWFWEFLTKELKLPKEKLYVTVFAGDKKNNLPPDNESIEIWKKLGIPENKIFKYGPEENWWSRAGVPGAMPPGEPGGPDSEVFYEFTQIPHIPQNPQNTHCHPNCECGRFLEIGNSVFMQYKKNPDKSFSELPNKNVDFGGGLERILAAVNNTPDIFETDLFEDVIKSIVKNSVSKNYYIDNEQKIIRTIADHLKAAVFLIKAGVSPTNKDRGYILRRLIRRISWKFSKLGSGYGKETISSVKDMCQSVIKTYGKIYFDLEKDLDKISSVISEEMERFSDSLKKGLVQVYKLDKVDGKIAFDFYQNYGIPLELISEIFKEKGQKIDEKQFYAEFEKHKNLSRSASSKKFKGGLEDQSEQTIKYHTATHLLHQALFDIVGRDIRQEGSNITSERLRFDFYSTKKPSPEEIEKVEQVVNEKIADKLPVEFKIIPKSEALQLGAKSFFRERYPDMVKVYSIGNYSKEFCAGPHVKNTSKIGKIEIYKFEKIGSNLYRIYAK